MVSVLPAVVIGEFLIHKEEQLVTDYALTVAHHALDFTRHVHLAF